MFVTTWAKTLISQNIGEIKLLIQNHWSVPTKTRKHANSEVQKPTDVAFYAAVNHRKGPLRKQNFTLTGSKDHGF